MSERGNSSFSVSSMGDAGWLYSVAEGLLRVNLVNEKRFSSVGISRTLFDDHSILGYESTILSASYDANRKNPAEIYPTFNFQTYLLLGRNYTNRDHLGYISDTKAADIKAVLQENSPYFEVSTENSIYGNNLVIGSDGMVIRVNLGEPSLDAKIAHQQGGEAIGDSCPIDNSLHELITLELQGKPSSQEGVINSLLGIPLTSEQGFRVATYFYASGYIAFVRAFCEVEGVQPPRPSVLLGSALLNQ